MLERIKRAIWRHIASKYLFQTGVQERIWRQAFFFNAFRALSFNGIKGAYAEFGSWGGRTFAFAHCEARRHGHSAKLWAFDSFQGLPQQASEKDEHPAWQPGTMATSEPQFHAICAANGIRRDEYCVVPGYYEESLARIGDQGEPQDIALAYIDCDLYSSTRAVLEFLMPRVKHGMIIAFDDYFCWSATQVSGERKSQLDVFSGHPKWELTPYMQFGWAGQSFVVEDKAIRSG